MSSQSLPKYGQFPFVFCLDAYSPNMHSAIFFKNKMKKFYRFFISIPRWEKDKNYFTLLSL